MPAVLLNTLADAVVVVAKDNNPRLKDEHEVFAREKPVAWLDRQKLHELRSRGGAIGPEALAFINEPLHIETVRGKDREPTTYWW